MSDMAEELRQQIELHAIPIDFDGLIKAGVLRKKGDWYEILDWKKLPEHAKVKVQQLKVPNLVKFGKPFKRPRAKK